MLSQYLMIDSKNAHGNYSMMTCGKILPKDYQVIILCLSFFNLSLFKCTYFNLKEYFIHSNHICIKILRYKKYLNRMLLYILWKYSIKKTIEKLIIMKITQKQYIYIFIILYHMLLFSKNPHIEYFTETKLLH